MQLNQIPKTTVNINGENHLYFSGTSYLGMSNLLEFHEIIFKNIKKWGSSFGSSRNANIKLDVYEKAERKISKFLKREDCVAVSSGTLAGLLALKTLEKIGTSFFYMPKTHPAILPKNAISVFEENNLNSLLLNSKKETICIVVDAIATLETAPYNFDFLKLISNQKKVYLLVDESHSLGVLGEKGNGISASINHSSHIELIVVSSLNKAFSVSGGVIAGNKNFINLVKKESLFIGSAPMNPAFLESFIDAQELYQNQSNKLKENCSYVFDKIKNLDKVQIDENYPVFFVDDEKIAANLLSKNIIITSFYYPTIIKKVNRIVLNANHTKEQLDFLCKNLLSN
ncbi:aminotransferase class I/II-fold pyridoxal phosphate-dependent enzyme [uncultured Polaribacter sp.]|uniref:aminotransferase class I/II-fold pyridoxal phosphate-dependent enzyme n=1 Tax=uncultured Polaribacter sp. TaxID=174711 RepID=UPI0026391353|nr:aminotransferase class I/II-fold pyridoxal phosphate-dependent enzyme [uncultured Polaribacter sp.]